MKKQNQQTLGEAIKLMFATYKMNEKMLAVEAEEMWAKTMGAQIDKYTENVFVKNKILYVKLKSPELKTELSFGKSKIIQHINEELKSDFLQDLVFI